jgi:hypothetical protein
VTRDGVGVRARRSLRDLGDRAVAVRPFAVLNSRAGREWDVSCRLLRPRSCGPELGSPRADGRRRRPLWTRDQRSFTSHGQRLPWTSDQLSVFVRLLSILFVAFTKRWESRSTGGTMSHHNRGGSREDAPGRSGRCGHVEAVRWLRPGPSASYQRTWRRTGSEEPTGLTSGTASPTEGSRSAVVRLGQYPTTQTKPGKIVSSSHSKRVGDRRLGTDRIPTSRYRFGLGTERRPIPTTDMVMTGQRSETRVLARRPQRRHQGGVST